MVSTPAAVHAYTYNLRLYFNCLRRADPLVAATPPSNTLLIRHLSSRSWCASRSRRSAATHFLRQPRADPPLCRYLRAQTAPISLRPQRHQPPAPPFCAALRVRRPSGSTDAAASVARRVTNGLVFGLGVAFALQKPVRLPTLLIDDVDDDDEAVAPSPHPARARPARASRMGLMVVRVGSIAASAIHVGM